MTDKIEEKLGSFNARMAASIIDLGLLLLMLMPLSSLLSFVIFGEDAINSVLKEVAGTNGVTDADALYKKLAEKHFFSRYIILNLITLGFTMVYCLVFWIKCDASPGKWLLGLRIVDVKTGMSPSVKQYIVRMLSYFLSALPLMIGFMMINYTKTHQGLHDRIAGTYVIHFPRDYSALKEWFRKFSLRSSLK